MLQAAPTPRQMSARLAGEIEAARAEAAKEEALMWATAIPLPQEEATADTWLTQLR